MKHQLLQIQCQSRTGNIMTDALNRKARHPLRTIVITQLNLLRELQDLGIQLVLHKKANVQLRAPTLQPFYMEEIRVDQDSDLELQRIKLNVEKGKLPQFVVHKDKTFRNSHLEVGFNFNELCHALRYSA